MTAYATRAQALAYAGRLAKSTGETSVPSLSDLDQFLTDCTGEIDAALGQRGFSTPITVTGTFLDSLTALCAKGAAAHMFTAANMTTDDTGRNAGSLLLKEYTTGLAALRSGNVPVGLGITERDTAVGSTWTDAGATNAPGISVYGDVVTSYPIFRIGRSY